MISPVRREKTGLAGRVPFPPFSESVLNALPDAVIVVSPSDQSDTPHEILYANMAAEHFFSASESFLVGKPLSFFLLDDSPVFSLIRQVVSEESSLSENLITLSSPRFGEKRVTLHITMATEGRDCVVIVLSERSLAERIGRQLFHRNAVRSVTGMAAILAHEIKNPLSGIRGAAQLLEQHADEKDRTLTQLICEETDRICALVDRMGVFSDDRPIERGAVNVHRVLEHVRRLAENGFAAHVRFTEQYDPSLPPVYGNRDQLVQIFLNLVKNAAEAAPKEGGEIILSTAYQHGMRIAVPGADSRINLPLLVSVQDNGPGIPEDIQPVLFEPFVTTKNKGTGLGLSLVAKMVSDHGGVIEFDSAPRRTVFRLRLPVHSENGSPGP